MQRAPGAVKRLTVAVLVNEAMTPDANGVPTVTPRAPEELADLEQLVSSAVGFDAARGDQITLRAMPFEPLPELGVVAEADGAFSQPLDMMQLIQIAALAAVAIFLGLFVVRPILMSGAGATALPGPQSEAFGGAGEVSDAGGMPPMMSAFPDMMAIEGPGMGMGDMGFGDDGGADSDDPVGRLRRMIADREVESLQILEDWMDEPAEAEKA